MPHHQSCTLASDTSKATVPNAWRGRKGDSRQPLYACHGLESQFLAMPTGIAQGRRAVQLTIIQTFLQKNPLIVFAPGQ
jgi:hypothetical protein